jgi:hypothetical protein
MKLVRFVLVATVLSSFLMLAQSNPVPFLNQPVVPGSTAPGGASFTLTVNGAGFVSASVVKWNGTALTTTFVSSAQLTAAVPAGNIAAAGTATITVSNPTPGGGVSNAEFFQIAATPASVVFSSLPPFGSNTFFSSSLSGDFNGDGKIDFAFFYSAYPTLANSVCVALGNGDGTFGTPACTALNRIDGNLRFTLGDFNGDGKLDIAGADEVGNEIDVFLGNGDGTLQTPKVTTDSLAPSSVVAGDFDRDGKLDLAVYNASDSSLGIFLGNGDGTFQSPVNYPGEPTVAMAVGDFNGDGILDLAGPNSGVLLGNGDGTFQAAISFTSAPFAVADLNGDGKPDLLTTATADSQGDRSLGFQLGNGDGTFQTPVPFGPLICCVVFYEGGSAVFADVNGDGKMDIVASYFGSPTTSDITQIYLGNGDGTLQTPINLSTVVGLIADFNNDGRPDLLTTALSDSSSQLQVLLQGSLPVAAISPTSLTFGSQATGTSSASQALTLTNSSTATLTLTGITITGTNAGDFSQTNTCGSTLAAAAKCAINVVFTPTAGGTRTASVSIADNAPGNPQLVALTGTAIVPGFSLAAVAPASQTVTPGQAANYSVTLSPVNGFSQAVALTCSGNPALSTCTVTPTSVTLDGTNSATIGVAVVTTAPSTSALLPLQPHDGERWALGLALSGVAGLAVIGSFGSVSRTSRQRMLRRLSLVCVISLGITWAGCGGSSASKTSSGGTAPGTYTLTVTGTSGSGSTAITNTTKVTLVVN